MEKSRCTCVFRGSNVKTKNSQEKNKTQKHTKKYKIRYTDHQKIKQPKNQVNVLMCIYWN